MNTESASPASRAPSSAAGLLAASSPGREPRRSPGWRDVVLDELFRRQLRERRDRTAIVSHNAENLEPVTRVSFGELDAATDRIAGGLIALGVSRGDVVAFQLHNRWEFLAIALACARVGAVANALMPILRQRELRFMLALSEARVFIVAKAFRGFGFLDMAREVARDTPTLKHVFALGGEGQESFEQHLLNPTPADRASGLLDPLRPDDLCQLLFTSGTTGEPKGVLHTSNTLLSHVLPFAERMRLTGEDVFMTPTPLAHQLGYLYGVLAPLALGSKVVLQDVWNAEVTARLIEAEGATVIMGATPMLYDLALCDAVPASGFRTLRYFISGGAPIPPAIVHRAQERLRCKVISVWGMTECSAVTTVLPDDPPDQSAVSDGKAMPHTAVKVVDKDGKPCPSGEAGRLFTRGASLFVGYLKRPQLYQVDEEGWFDTGDLARMDEAGYIRITGRAKDMIIRGGENVPVVEIEGLLYKHPKVAMVALVGMPDARLGEIGCAFVVPKPGTPPTLQELMQYLKECQVARSFWPERLELLDTFPMTATGKVLKVTLRERARALAAGGAK